MVGQINLDGPRIMNKKCDTLLLRDVPLGIYDLSHKLEVLLTYVLSELTTSY